MNERFLITNNCRKLRMIRAIKWKPSLFVVSTCIFLFFVGIHWEVSAFREEDSERLKTNIECVRCDLTEIDLRSSDLTDADMTGADLTGANRGDIDYLLGNILTPSAVV